MMTFFIIFNSFFVFCEKILSIFFISLPAVIKNLLLVWLSFENILEHTQQLIILNKNYNSSAFLGLLNHFE